MKIMIFILQTKEILLSV